MKTRKLVATAWLGVFALCLLVASCKKSSSKPSTGNNQVATKLVDKNWVISAAVLGSAVDINHDGTPDTDLYAVYIKGSCREDDYLRFLANGVLVEGEGDEICSDAIKPTWRWALTSQDTKLELTPSSGSSTLCEILSISATELKLRYIETEQFSEPVEVTVTYTKK